MTDLNENMETGVETGDQDFVEIQVVDDMNDLDEDNGYLSRNGKFDRSSGRKINHSADEDLGLDSETEIDETENNEDAEDQETEMMTMPSLQTVMSEMSHLKQRRRVLVHPIKVQELGHPKVLEIISKVSCEEIKLHFVRPHDNPEEWNGILLMHFGSTRSAQLATENLKSVRSDLNIKCNEDTAYASRSMEQWVKEEKGQKRWTDTMLWVKNIPEDTTESQLFEAFSDAEDVSIRRRVEKKGSSANTKEAFVVYRNGELAHAAAKAYQSNIPVINGLPLKVLKYHTPQEIIPRGLLKLKERRLVLKYMEKLSDMKQTAESDGAGTVPEWCTKRLERCKNVIGKDNRMRKSAGLPAPSLEELKSQKGIKVFRGKECVEALQKLGILPATSSKTIMSSPRKRQYKNEKDPEKPKIKSLLQWDDDKLGIAPTSRSSKCPSLLGDAPSLFTVPSKPMSSQWTNSSLNQTKPVTPGINKLLSMNPLLLQMGSLNSSASQAAFIKQQNAINFMMLMKQQQQSSNSVKGKTPLLASPESTNSFAKSTTSAKVPLLGMEPPSKILRLDATGSFCYDFKGQQLGAKSSRSSKYVSLLDL